jgi:hypothetical protein
MAERGQVGRSERTFSFTIESGDGGRPSNGLALRSHSVPRMMFTSSTTWSRLDRGRAR